MKLSDFKEKIERNLPKYAEYSDINLTNLFELRYIYSQCFTCLIFENYDSCILTTNYLLERMIKLSLIKKHTIKLIPWDDELYNAKIKEATDKYDSKTLNETLKLAREEDLIEESELTELKKFKDDIRNAYSHAEIQKIIKEEPHFQNGVIANLKNKTFKNVNITTLFPQLSQYHQYLNSQKIAGNYLLTVRKILLNLEAKI